MDKKLRLLYASSWSATIAVLFATFLTIWMELQVEVVKPFLTKITGHHWTTKSWFTVGVYVLFLLIFYFLKKQPTDQQVRAGVMRLFWVALLCAFIIFGFYGVHYLGE